MKKTCLLFLSICLIFSLVPLNTASAITAPIPLQSPSNWEPPVITPLTGDKEFTVKTLDPIALTTGTTKTENNLVVPAGFPLGQKQFGGEVALVKDFDGGTARACFSLPNYRYGWDGGISQWNGSAWTPLPSSLTEGKEGGPATVCTTIYGNGTYALIIGFTHPEKATADFPVCSEDFDAITIPFYIDGDGETFATFAFIILLVNQPFPEGTSIRYNIINVNPAGSLSGALYQTGYVYTYFDPLSIVFFLTPEDLQVFMDASGDFSDYLPPSYTHLTFHYLEGRDDLSFTLRVTTPNCYKDIPYNDFPVGPIGDD